MGRHELPNPSGETESKKKDQRHSVSSTRDVPSTLFTKEVPEGAASVVSPVFRTLLTYGEGTERFYLKDAYSWPSYEETLREKLDKQTESFLDKERKRQSFVTFAEHEGLTEINTIHDFQAKLDQMTQAFSALEPQELFDKLRELQNYYRIGTSLLQDANSYIAIQKTLERDDYNHLDAATLAEQYPHAMVSSLGEGLPNSAEFPQEELLIRPESSDEPIPLSFSPWGDNPTEYQQEAETFALHKEGILTAYLLFNLSERFSRVLGIDSYTGEYVSQKKDVETWEQANRYTTPLPTKFSQWIANGFRSEFFNGVVRDYDYLRMSPAEKYNRLACIILSEDTNEITIDSHNRRAISALKRQAFDEVVAAFEEATEPLNPLFESDAIEFAGYIIAENRASLGLAKEERSNNPLATLVPKVKALGYKTGIYLDPLKHEMKARMEQDNLDPEIVAACIEQALVETEAEPSYSIPPEMTWFINESLSVQSTLDASGNYMPLEDGMHKEKRSFDVAADIIDALRQMEL